MRKPAATAVPLHPLLADRWSPRAFDPTPLADEQVAALLEAARWAPSANNAQPWRFLVGRQGDRAHASILDALMPGNVAWAAAAPLLVVAVARTRDADGGERTVAGYELGLAVGQLTVQAHAEGLFAHQMGGFSADRLRESFGIPADHTPFTVVAVGRYGDASALAGPVAERERAGRNRLALDELAFADAWGAPLDLTAAQRAA